MKVTILVNNLAESGLLTEHGLSVLVETGTRRILFDTGQSETVLLGNARSLGAKLDRLDAVALSHAHYDHAGGLGALSSILQDIPLYCATGVPERLSLPENHRFKIRASSSPQEIAEGVTMTGHIRRSCPFEPEPEARPGESEKGMTGDIMLDEQALVVECAGGLLVITGCAHPGVVNIVQTAREIGRGDVFALLGGFHLGGASDECIKQTIAALKDSGVRRVYPAHCTGEEATEHFKDAFGEDCVPCTGGATFSL